MQPLGLGFPAEQLHGRYRRRGEARSRSDNRGRRPGAYPRPGVNAAVGCTMTIADGGYPGTGLWNPAIPHEAREPNSGSLSDVSKEVNPLELDG